MCQPLMATSSSLSKTMIGDNLINTDIVSYDITARIDEMDHCRPLEIAKMRQDMIARDTDRSKIQD